ncbi:hypothetical protein [Curtobacterium sp. MCSS17_016]|uniref:hypothetical protein n=1 Tax=Curtobacterium sp. MCSS17_016 TaxID=2175644 RepID=UPI0011B46500|nr:hypothetical protein [Curtobacterium sp. MCSS17_016]WIE81095.1 hypothetical protein DEJ19_021710 [Curtobacterium sp. MCSS17_016]
MTTLHDGIRAWAKGIYPTEAAVELLIRTGLATDDADFYGDTNSAFIEVRADKIIDRARSYSHSQEQILRLVASLLGEQNVNLKDAFRGLDRTNLQLALAAISHAAGAHEMTGWTVNDGDNGTVSNPDGPVVAWPER